MIKYTASLDILPKSTAPTSQILESIGALEALSPTEWQASIQGYLAHKNPPPPTVGLCLGP